MIESAIANWLTRTNERNYQIPYCQVLLTKGQRVLYISSHRPMEQGKDVITVDANGGYHAYQLKTGDIDQKTFRTIKGEIDELVERAIIHPSVDKSKGHKAYLVLNGQITDEVRYLIDQMNADNNRRDRRVAYLDVVTLPGLVQDFVTAQGQFLPATIHELSMLLDVYNADGIDFLPTHQVFRLFETGLFADASVPKQHARNAIAASVIITGYVLQAFQRAKNEYAVFEGWTILAGCMIRYAHRTGLRPQDWHASLNLARAAINEALQNLWEEVASRTNLLEGYIFVDGADLYRARVTIVLGALTAYAVRAPDFVAPKELRSLLLAHQPRLWIWGESAFPYLFSIAIYLEQNGERAAANELWTAILDGTSVAFTNPQAQELAPPYYSAERILRTMLQISGDQAELRSSGGSFILRPTLHALARRDMRVYIAANWKQISRVHVREFRPAESIDIFSWRVANGTNITEILQPTQSWALLQQEARSPSGALDVLMPYKDILHYFILVCPFRATPDVIKLLDAES